MNRTSTGKIRTVDMAVLDKVFAMGAGYVLDFSNRTYAEFFREELHVNIDDPRWTVQGGSKAKRLRYYLRQVDPKAALKALTALWEYREASGVARDYRLSSNGCGWVEARSAGRRGVLAVHLTGGGRGAPWRDIVGAE